MGRQGRGGELWRVKEVVERGGKDFKVVDGEERKGRTVWGGHLGK